MNDGYPATVAYLPAGSSNAHYILNLVFGSLIFIAVIIIAVLSVLLSNANKELEEKINSAYEKCNIKDCEGIKKLLTDD